MWNGYFAPAGVPRPILMRLNQEFLKALTAPSTRAKLDATELIGGTPEQFGAYVKETIETFGKLAKMAGLQPR